LWYPDHDDPQYILSERRPVPAWLLDGLWADARTEMEKESDDKFLRSIKVAPL